MSAERLLEGLDPEQREVATASTARCVCSPAPAPARPGRSRTGSPTASPPGRSRRPRCWPSRSRRARPASCAPGWPGSAPPASRPARSTPPRCGRPATSGHRSTAASCPALVASKLGLLGEAVGRNRLKASQADLRDLAGEIEWAKVSNVRPDDYARLAPRPGRAVEGYDAATVAAGLRGVRRGQARPQPHRHGGRPALRRGRARATTSGSRPRSAGSTSGSSSTSSRTSARCSPAARPLARRPRRGVRRRRPGADDLLVRRRVGRLPARLPDEVPRHHLDHPACATTGRRRRSSRRPTP